MLKHVFLNRRKIPVPVPISILSEAIDWVEGSLVKAGYSITKLELDGLEIDINNIASSSLNQKPLSIDNKLCLQIDSPLDLAIQSIDALNNLTLIIRRTIRPLMVKIWDTLPQAYPEGLESFLDDLALFMELTDHLIVLLSGQVSTTNIENSSVQLDSTKVLAEMAIGQSDWKGLTKVIIKQLFPQLEDVASELSLLQKCVFEAQADRKYSS
tara:strand:- start:7 stop:642 length:636 start_codon:yes stop_codon:yes gene_type:complete